MRVCHVHSTFVLGWGVVEWCGVEVVEIVTGRRLVFCKWLWGFEECGLGFCGVVCGVAAEVPLKRSGGGGEAASGG